MRIREIRVYRVELPLVEGRYAWSGGRSVEVFDSTLVAVATEDGLVGWGESCPLGPAYQPAYAAGVRSGLAELGPALLGADPRELAVIERRMAAALKGHPFVKSALDMACHDLAAKAAGVPLVTLLGGRSGAAVELYRAISQDTPEAMAAAVARYRAEGYRRFQLKVGDDPDRDIERIAAVRALLDRGEVLVADANTGWLPHQALRVVRALRGVDVYIEQPCASLEECLVVRRATDHPFVLDEIVDGTTALLRAWRQGAMDVVNIKISKVGGIGPARRLRELCVELGIATTLEDSWGGDVVTAAIAHLAHSTPEAFRFSATDFNAYVERSVAADAPRGAGGVLRAADGPGLGLAVEEDALGAPVAVIA
ncbi:MAG: mandelate racemase/muconate lactonizing enzyme family protein [Geminicoccaceae bacterium]|nr:mandelate racemase/muconate lactonizing enzyme family protein [Geminicoccaceae bacterium]